MIIFLIAVCTLLDQNLKNAGATDLSYFVARIFYLVDKYGKC